MTLIAIALLLSALYCGGMWLYVARETMMGRYDAMTAETHTFYLGLCFILALGFLGLMLK
jgi:hypothetical protein